MNKMLVAVFDTETQAFEGLTALKELHKGGDISLYSTAVIVKDAEGKVEIKQSADRGPVGTDRRDGKSSPAVRRRPLAHRPDDASGGGEHDRRRAASRAT